MLLQCAAPELHVMVRFASALPAAPFALTQLVQQSTLNHKAVSVLTHTPILLSMMMMENL